MDWRVYYDLDVMFDNTQGSPADAPGFGALVIAMCEETVNRAVLHGFDYYIFVGGEWLGVDRFGLVDWLCNRLPDVEGVIAGRSVNNATFDRMVKLATNDPDFPPKSGSRVNERPKTNVGE